jgi:hypothetical protein
MLLVQLLVQALSLSASLRFLCCIAERSELPLSSSTAAVLRDT